MTEQPQIYEVSYFKVGDYKDANGNTWCNVLFKGRANEPLRWVVKDPSTISVGQTVYGHIETKTSQAGKPYQRFYRDQRPDPSQAPTGSSSGSSWTPRDDMAIRAQWAIGQAIAYLSPDLSQMTGSPDSHIEKWAKTFFAMVDRVKAPTQAPLQSRVTNEPPDDDAEFASLIGRGMRADNIPEDEIPAEFR